MKNVSTLLRPTMLSAALFIFVICLFGISAASVKAASITVTGNGDAVAADGQCTLREAITAANTNAAVNDCPAGDAGADTINFDTAGVFATPQTIILTSGELGIGSGLTISGPGAALLTVRRDPLAGEFRIFTVGSGVTATLSGLRISGGKTISSPGYGGGILNHGTLTLNNCTVSDNTAYIGGGILSGYGGTVLTINNSLVSDNRANGYGGGVFSFDGTILTINKSTVSGNQGLGGYGGGVVSAYGGLLTIDASTISNNYALYGGGGIDNGTTGVITNTTISGNSGNQGGGIFTNSATYLSIRFCTIVDNHGFVKGGGIAKVSGGLDINNSIVAGNTAPITPEVNWQVTSGDYNLFGNTSGMDGLPGTHNITNVDPMLGPLQYNGGPTKTHALVLGSPAINAGSNPSALTTDQRGTGFGRVVGTAADIGSFEIQPACAGLSFAPAVIYAVGNAPRSVATADFNGDGKTDLAVANRDSDNISILTGNGDGTFEPAVNYAVGDSPYPVTTADFNGDGKADLATANYASGNISVLTGNGDGTFAPAVNFAAGNPIFVVTGDFNGDGKTDLAAAINTNDILVLTGNGDGTFAPAGSFAVGASGPLSITTGDFNGDSKTDLASANRFSNNISVLTGNGDGTFAPAVNLAAGNEPLSVTTGDFNGDGKTDLVASNAISNTLVALFGNGDGTFASAVNFAEGGLWITTGDFNGDGKTDIALANGSNSMPVFTGNGDGTFSPRVTFAVGNSPLFVTTGDFNGDGKTDLAASGPGSNNISVLLNGCTSNTAPVANDDSYSVDEDGSLGEAAPGVLGDDTDNENDSLTATLATGPLHAQSFTLNADGSFSYTPQPNYNGPDSFTYGANDGSLDSNIATVAITVNAVADTPSVTNAATSEDVQSTSGLVISRNATDGSEVTHFKITNIANGTLFLNNGTTPINNGTFITFAQANAGLKFSPAANFFGAASFDVQASVSPSDLGLGGVVVTATITVNAVPDTPSVTNASTNEDVQTSSGLVISRNAVDSAEVTFFKVTGITNGTMFLNDGASPVFNGNFISVAQGNAGLKFTPNANFSGAGSFQLQAALIDHTLGGGIVTATITVNAVNDAPLVSATPETQPAVQYSDAIQPVTINASDLETPVGSLSIGFSYVRNAEPSVAGLPAGISQGGVAGAWTVSGTAGVPAGTYVITARVTDTGDGSSPAMTSSDTFTIVVTRENAVAAPRLSNPVAMQVASAGGSASGVTGQICFDITEPSDGSAGNTALINAATVQLSAVGGGSAGSITPSAVTFSGGGAGGTRSACFTLTLAGTSPNVFEVTLNIGGDYYTGSGTTAFLVFDPSAGFASGGGWIINPNTGYRANYGVNVKYLKNGNAQGSILYIEHRPDGDYKVKSTSLNSSGGFAIVPIAGGSEAQIAGKANYGVNDVFTGNHSFIARVIDKGNPGTNDQFGLKLTAPNGQVMNEFTFAPQLLGGGNNQVPKK